VFTEISVHPLSYLDAAVHTVLVTAAGLVAGMTIGAAAAILLWASPLASGMITPFAPLMRSVPVVAMIPVIARLLGYSTQTVLAITAIISFFPAFVFTLNRIRNPPATTSDLFSVFNASTKARLTHLLLPHAVPGLLVALRMTAPTAVLAAMLAEYLLGSGGLGQLFSQSVAYGRNSQAWAAAVVATAVSATLFALSRAVERWGTTRTT
jgi:NitT/TauT family transport system permease protein